MSDRCVRTSGGAHPCAWSLRHPFPYLHEVGLQRLHGLLEHVVQLDRRRQWGGGVEHDDGAPEGIRAVNVQQAWGYRGVTMKFEGHDGSRQVSQVSLQQWRIPRPVLRLKSHHRIRQRDLEEAAGPWRPLQQAAWEAEPE